MKKSEVINKYRNVIADIMVECYNSVLESYGRIQYKVYIWEDGVIDTLEQVQGDNAYLVPKDREPRELYYVTTVDSPCFDPWDYADEAAPDDEAVREQMERIIIAGLVDDYNTCVHDIIWQVIEDAKRWEEQQ